MKNGIGVLQNDGILDEKEGGIIDVHWSKQGLNVQNNIINFSSYEIQECLFDKKRTLNFLSAIKETVMEGDYVVDAGSGTGILGLFAARSGAKKVYCIESNRRFIDVIKRNAEINNFSEVITVIQDDATKVKLPHKVDVIVCELLSTGLFFEPEVQIINNLRRFLKFNGRIIPMNCRSWIQLVSAQRDIYGLDFDYDSRYKKLKMDKIMSNKRIFDELNFFIDESLEVDKKVVLKAVSTGIVNAVRISSKAQLTERIFATQSKFLFNPLIIFLKKVMHVTKGKQYEIHIQYKRSDDTLGTNIIVNEL